MSPKPSTKRKNINLIESFVRRYSKNKDTFKGASLTGVGITSTDISLHLIKLLQAFFWTVLPFQASLEITDLIEVPKAVRINDGLAVRVK